MFYYANSVSSCLQHNLLCQRITSCLKDALRWKSCSLLFTAWFILPTVYILVYNMFGLANCVTSCLQHVLFCQPCIFLFAICFALQIVYLLLYNMFCLPTVYLLVYNMFWFANSLTSCLQHVLFYQSCSFLFTTCFILPTV